MSNVLGGTSLSCVVRGQHKETVGGEASETAVRPPPAFTLVKGAEGAHHRGPIGTDWPSVPPRATSVTDLAIVPSSSFNVVGIAHKDNAVFIQHVFLPLCLVGHINQIPCKEERG